MVSQRICLAIIAACFVLMPQTVPAQQKVAVEVTHTSKDLLGQRLTYLVKEGIRRSAGLRLTDINEPRLMFHLLTINMFQERPGTSVCYGFTITFLNAAGAEIFLSTGLSGCGSQRVNEVAEILVANIDKEADFVRRGSLK
jgi:hypothetical protein